MSDWARIDGQMSDGARIDEQMSGEAKIDEEMSDGARIEGGTCTLTFDDGPDQRWTARVLAELRECGAHATFFVIGERVARAPAMVRAILEEGHDVELHCDRHVRHTELDEDELEADTVAALQTLARANVAPTRWRAPWGVVTEATRRVAGRHGLELVGWTIDTHDWRGDEAGRMLELAEPTLEDGAIVLMHDGLGPGATRSGCEETVELVGPLVRSARGMGLEVLSLSEVSRRQGRGVQTPSTCEARPAEPVATTPSPRSAVGGN